MDTSYPHIKPQKRPYPKRMTYLDGWRLYKSAFIQHHIQGWLAGGAILFGETQQMYFGLMWTFLYVAYQALSYLRKQDSPSLDITDYMVGMGIAYAVFIIFGWVGVVWNLAI